MRVLKKPSVFFEVVFQLKNKSSTPFNNMNVNFKYTDLHNLLRPFRKLNGLRILPFRVFKIQLKFTFFSIFLFLIQI